MEKDQKPPARKVPWIYIRDAQGHKSISVTLLMVTFFVTTCAYILSIFSKIGPLEVRSFDVGACSAFFIPVLTLYFSRRYTDAKMGISQAREAAASASTPLVAPPPPPDAVASSAGQQGFVPPQS